MRQRFWPLLAASCFAINVQAQSNAAGPFVTPAGALQFVRVERGFEGMLDTQIFDRIGANTLTHFDDIDSANYVITRMLVQTNAGPVLYDFRHRPPVVLHTGKHITVKRVFWQGDEVVLQSSEGWFGFKGGVLTRLQSSRMIFR